jgi:hypothetical protein
MFLISWVFSLVFCVFYVCFGLVFYVYFCRFFDKKRYEVLLGRAYKDSDGDYHFGGEVYFRFSVVGHFLCVLIFWPALLCILAFFCFMKLFFRFILGGVFRIFTKMDAALPKVSIQGHKSDEE